MKYIVLLVTIATFIACNDKKENKSDLDNNQEISNQDEEAMMDKESYKDILVDDPEEEGSKMLVGEIEADYLESKRFSWYDTEMDAYSPDSEIITQLEKELIGKDITVFMGTWCEDSQREVPRFAKLLSQINFDGSLKMYALSRDKDTPEGVEKDRNIEYVPTIIISENGEELGRVVESTQDSLEKDLLAIASGQDYKHVYEE